LRQRKKTEIGEEEDERDAGERKKKSEKNVWWGEGEKKVIFLKKLKVNIIILII
jgi:ribosomal protein S8E